MKKIIKLYKKIQKQENYQNIFLLLMEFKFTTKMVYLKQHIMNMLNNLMMIMLQGILFNKQWKSQIILIT